jgi:uncharacterized Fe-S cluster protein YjdI
MENKEIVKEYTNDEITVVWKPKKCIHSEYCWRGLPDVFKPKSKPWVDITGADSNTIAKQVEKCPSGALSYYWNKESQDNFKASEEAQNVEHMKIKVFESGPIMVNGEVTIEHKDGTTELKKNVALCRCGASTNKPFCDGSHKKVEFKD